MFLKDIDAHTTLYLPDSHPGHFVSRNALPMPNPIYPLSQPTHGHIICFVEQRIHSAQVVRHIVPPNVS